VCGHVQICIQIANLQELCKEVLEMLTCFASGVIF
jgi:hypothetical protein